MEVEKLLRPHFSVLSAISFFFYTVKARETLYFCRVDKAPLGLNRFCEVQNLSL